MKVAFVLAPRTTISGKSNGVRNRCINWASALMKVHSNEYRSSELLPLGVHGVLYFPGCFDPEVLNIGNMNKLAPKADDIWYKAMHLKNNVKCIVTGAYPNFKSQFTTLESAHVDALYQDNVKNDHNVKQLKDVFEYYGLTI